MSHQADRIEVTQLEKEVRLEEMAQEVVRDWVAHLCSPSIPEAEAGILAMV